MGGESGVEIERRGGWIMRNEKQVEDEDKDKVRVVARPPFFD